MNQKQEKRDKIIVRTGVIGILANTFLSVTKIVIGLLASSIAIVMDGVNNIGDALSAVITILGAKLAGKAPDKKHPYGYGRIEYFSTLIIAVIILYAGVTALVESVKNIFAPAAPDHSWITLTIIVIGILVKVVLSGYVVKTGRSVKSDALIASGTEQRFDAIVSAATLVAAVIYLQTKINIESYLAAIISLFLIKSGVETLLSTISSILGERVESDVSAQIKETICSVDGVLGVYDLIFSDYGPDRLLASAHIEVTDDKTASEIDLMIRKATELVYQTHGVAMTAIGIYSKNTKTDEAASIRNGVAKIIGQYPHIKQMHGFYADLSEQVLRFDLMVDFEVKDRHAYYQEVIEKIRAAYPAFRLVTNIDTDFSD